MRLAQDLKCMIAAVRAHPLHNRIASGAVWSLAGSAGAQLLVLAASIPVARLLGRDDFGGLGIVQSTILMFAIFAGPALGSATTKYVAQHRGSDPQRAARIIAVSTVAGVLVSIVMGAALWLAAPYLTESTLGRPELTPALRLAAPALVFAGINGVQQGILGGLEEFRAVAAVEIGRGAVMLPAMVLSAYLWGLPGAIGALGGVGALTAVAYWYVTPRSAGRPRIRALSGASPELVMLGSFAAPAVLSAATVLVSTWIAQALLVRGPGGLADMGVFNAANQWRIAILFLPAVLARPILPMLSESAGRSADDFNAIFRINMWLTGGVVVAAAAAVSLLSRPLMSAYGPGYADQWYVLALLALSAVFSALAGVVGTIIWSMGRLWWGLAFNSVWAAIFLGCFVALRPHGAAGLAASFTLSYALHLAVVTLYARMRIIPDIRPGRALAEAHGVVGGKA